MIINDDDGRSYNLRINFYYDMIKRGTLVRSTVHYVGRLRVIRMVK